MLIKFPLACVLVFAGACRTLPSQPTDEEQVRAAIDGLIAADNRADIAAVLDGYCRDAELVPPQGDTVRGHEAIRPRYVELFATWRPSLRALHTVTRIEQGRGVDIGRTVGTLTSLADGPTKLVDDVYEATLRYEDGSWRVARLQWHPRSAPDR